MPRLHRKCSVCGNSIPQAMVRPILKSIEMKTAEVFSQDGADPTAAYTDVCRECWHNFITRKSKAELITILETVTCDLWEFAKALRAVNTRSEDSNNLLEEDLPF